MYVLCSYLDPFRTDPQKHGTGSFYLSTPGSVTRIFFGDSSCADGLLERIFKWCPNTKDSAKDM